MSEEVKTPELLQFEPEKDSVVKKEDVIIEDEP